MSHQIKSYQLKVNDFSFSLTDQDIAAANIIQNSPVDFNIIKDNRSFNVRLQNFDCNSKYVTVEVEGEQFQIIIKDELDMKLEKMGYGNVAPKQLKEIKAPMPGLVLNIAVTEGQEVVAGDKLLILEAMKMENSILMPDTAIIKKIKIKPGDAVEKGQILIELQ